MSKTIEIQAFENGPYVISGRAAERGADGVRVERPGTSVALCRCGGSAQLPYCDGAHKASDFSAAAVTVEVTPNPVAGSS